MSGRRYLASATVVEVTAVVPVTDETVMAIRDQLRVWAAQHIRQYPDCTGVALVLAPYEEGTGEQRVTLRARPDKMNDAGVDLYIALHDGVIGSLAVPVPAHDDDDESPPYMGNVVPFPGGSVPGGAPPGGAA